MKSVRNKLFVILSLSILSVLLVGLLLNAFYFEKFYIYENRQKFERLALEIEASYKDDKKRIEEEIEALGRIEEVTIELVDKDLEIQYSSIAKSQHGDKLPREIESFIKGKSPNQGLIRLYGKVVKERPDGDLTKLVYISKLDDHMIVLSKSIKSIRESVMISNRFNIYSGVILLITACFFMFSLSKRITKPIRDMETLANNIAEQNFDYRYTDDGKDEIGQLGMSLNRMSDQLSQSIDTLNKDIENRKRLVRNISHELKTPIGIIKGYSEGLQFGIAETKEEQDKYLKVVVDECNRLNEMILELLQLSKLEYSQIKTTFEIIPADVLSQRIIEQFQPIMDEEQIQFETFIESDISFYGDLILLTRAISNYITNAVKHVDNNKKIKLSIKSQGQMTTIDVMNSGQTVPLTYHEKIWDVFYKVDEEENTPLVGSGIGLSIVKQIAELHGGQVGIKNNEDGVTFFMNVPKKFI